MVNFGAVKYVCIIMGILSMLSSSFIMISFYVRRRLHFAFDKNFNKMLFTASLVIFFEQLIRTMAVLDSPIKYDEISCKITGMLLNVFEIALDLWYVCIALELYIGFVRPMVTGDARYSSNVQCWRPAKRHLTYQALVILAALSVNFIALFEKQQVYGIPNGNSYPWCWLVDDYQFVFGYIYLYISFATCIFFYIRFSLVLYSNWSANSSYLTEMRAAVFQIYAYPVTFVLCMMWAPLAQASFATDHRDELESVAAISSSSLGVLNAFIFVFSDKHLMQAWRMVSGYDRKKRVQDGRAHSLPVNTVCKDKALSQDSEEAESATVPQRTLTTVSRDSVASGDSYICLSHADNDTNLLTFIPPEEGKSAPLGVLYSGLHGRML